MMGGEFCANACRALAAVVVASGRAASGQDVPVLSSGVASPVILRAEPGVRGWHAWVRAPGAVGVHRIGAEAVLVRFPGIVHLVIPQPLPEAPQDEAAAWRSRLQLDQEPAVGCIWVTPSHEGLCIAPLVWVRATQTVVLESACGSGTLALAYAFPHMPWAHGVDVIQPSGQALRVEDRGDGLWLGGPARVSLFRGRLMSPWTPRCVSFGWLFGSLDRQ